ncbi:hypothetical protein NKH18_43545 [Streptomyces sp. M10(2022)]
MAVAGGTAQGEGRAADLPLGGMTVVVTGAMTGSLAELSRNQMNELIERAGGSPRPASPSAPPCWSPVRRQGRSGPRPRRWASISRRPRSSRS